MCQLFFLGEHFPVRRPRLEQVVQASVAQNMELGLWGDLLREDMVAIDLPKSMICIGPVRYRGPCRPVALDLFLPDRDQGHHPEDGALGAVDDEVQVTVATAAAVIGAGAGAGIEGLDKHI